MVSHEIISAMKQKGYLLSSKTHPFSTSVQDYLSRHDIVFASPQKGGFEGLPLGNGDISAMVWTEDRSILIQVNKNDLWTQPDGEAPMLLRSCGQIRMEFDEPCFEWLYLEKFEARLSMGHETVTIFAQTPFSTVQAEIWVDPNQNVLMAEVRSEDAEGEKVPFRIILERYGSRALRYWYCDYHKGAENGLGDPKTASDSRGISLGEPFREADHIALGIRMEASGCDWMQTGNGPRSGEISCQGGPVYLAAGFSVKEHLAEAEAEALKITRQAMAASAEERKNARDGWWKEYWDRSFLTLSPDGEDHDLDYLENLYYVQAYALGCSSRGEYPMIFNGGTFTWNHDLRQWTNPHHWNIQQPYWAVEAMNRPEEMVPYLKTYTRMIPAAQKFAREYHGVTRGIQIAEQHDFSGRMIAYFSALTPANQISQQFWNHYLYSGDVEYLRSVGYPYIRECAEFYTDYAKKDPKTGVYAIGPATCCECTLGNNFWNTAVDLAMSRYVLRIAIRSSKLLHLDEDRREKWQDLLDHLPDFSYIQETDGRESIAPAITEKGEVADFKTTNHAFCRNTSPISPCPIIGSRDKGTRLYEATKTSLDLYYFRRSIAIIPTSVMWARFGNGNRALEFLYDSVEQLQHFPQGFFFNVDHWYKYSRYATSVDDYLTECQRDYIYDESLVYPDVPVAKSEETINLPMRPFVQAGFETSGILAHALQEMLLQSYEEIIRLGPALPKNFSGRFTLRAAGAFMVTGFAEQGELLPLAVIHSDRGAPCRLEPWFPVQETRIAAEDGTEVPFTISSEGDLLFTLESGKSAVIWSHALKEEEIPDASLEVYQNHTVKIYHQARIGSAVSY